MLSFTQERSRATSFTYVVILQKMQFQDISYGPMTYRMLLT